MNMKRFGIVLMVVGALVMVSCAGTSTANSGQSVVQDQAGASIPAENEVETRPLKKTVLDWSDRTMGQDQTPAWLKPLVINGNGEEVRAAFGIAGGDTVKFSVAQRANLDEARLLSGLLFAQKTAQELKQYVCIGAASRLDQAQMDMVEEISTATKVTMSGTQRVADFWQLVETENPGTRTKARGYVYYIVWTMDEALWTQVVRKFVNDVIGQIPDRAVQTQLANAYTEIDAAARREEQRSDAEFQRQVNLQAQAARDAQERAMAGINAQTAANAAAAEVAQTQVLAEARARAAAYRSGDPAVAAAASTTAADFDWIDALTTAADVLIN